MINGAHEWRLALASTCFALHNGAMWLAFSPLNLAAYPLWLLLTLFAAGAALVWWAGTHLARSADLIADRTGMGRAFAGLLLLGGATSLPEIATTVTAASLGNAAMAGNNLLGGIAMQLAVLAAVDGLVMRQGALTFFTPRPALLMQGVMLLMMCALAAAAIAAGDRFVILGVGGWSFVLLAFYLLALWTMQRYEGSPRWEPSALPDNRDIPQAASGSAAESNISTRRASLLFMAACLGVLVGGYAVARSADVLAIRTGIGSSLLGATLVAFTTSLPEVSTTVAAVRLGAYSMAVANILGTNSIEVALLFVADTCYRDGSIVNALDEGALFLAALGAVLTCIYLWGLLERRDRTILRFGYDSAAVLVLYLAGLVIFYFLGGGT